jgi:hypothetical protein
MFINMLYLLQYTYTVFNIGREKGAGSDSFKKYSVMGMDVILVWIS